MAKKQFPCGHSGKGQYCHTCEQQKQRQMKFAETKLAKQEWKETFQHDAIDLTKLPSKGLVQKAREIISQLQSGAPYTQFKGKRLNHDRTIISIPVNNDYRIICIDTIDAGLKIKSLLSHEEYNMKKPGT